MKRAESLPESQTSARRLRKKLTPSEKVIWRFVSRRRMGVHFRRQEPVGPYVADFLSYKAKLVVEADGTQHNESDADEIRDAYLEAAGFRVMRFMNRFIALEPEAVEDMIRDAVREQLAHLESNEGDVGSDSGNPRKNRDSKRALSVPPGPQARPGERFLRLKRSGSRR